MKVLWIVNSMMAEIAEESNRKAGFGGGWIPAMSERLRYQSDVDLAIVVFGNNEKLSYVHKNNIQYYIFPQISGLHKNGGGFNACKIWRTIIEEFQPDIIHIYGTEQPTSVELIRNFKNIPIIVSLQGILTEYYKHYYGDMEFKDIFGNITLADICLGSSGYFGRKKFSNNLKYEQEILETVKFVEGRTTWDRRVSESINPELKYYKCSRMLRKEFYTADKWDCNNMRKHTIFIHQGNYAIKGLHMLINAVGILQKKYPDIVVNIAGQDPTKKNGIKGRLAINGYSKYIKKLAEQLGVYKKMNYVGSLDASKVAEVLSNSNVMVIPSAIENSPNSLAEAMIIGTPCVASYVGGNAEMLDNGNAGLLYAYNDPVMLADAIDRIFSSDEYACAVSKCEQRVASERHNPEKLVNDLKRIYQNVVNVEASKKEHY